jgi:GNAT superfamily N-acetyltransferase
MLTTPPASADPRRSATAPPPSRVAALPRPVADARAADAAVVPLRDAHRAAAVDVALRTIWADPDDPCGPELQEDPLLDGVLARMSETDPDLCRVAVRDGRVVGLCASVLRDGTWLMSQLAVAPDEHRSGVGARLAGAVIEAAAARPEGPPRAAVLACSTDVRMLRGVVRAGFAVSPALHAVGPVDRRRLTAEPTVRDADPERDAELLEALSRAARGASHRRDLPALVALGWRPVVDPRGAWGAAGPSGHPSFVVGTDDAAAAAVLRALLADAPVEGTAVEGLRAGQDWALRVVADLGLELAPSGAVATLGAVGAGPYLPSGLWL